MPKFFKCPERKFNKKNGGGGGGGIQKVDDNQLHILELNHLLGLLKKTEKLCQYYQLKVVKLQGKIDILKKTDLYTIVNLKKECDLALS